MSTTELFTQIESLPEPLKEEVAHFVSLLVRIKPEKKTEREFGAFKGKIKMSADFDAPLEEFKDYM